MNLIGYITGNATNIADIDFTKCDVVVYHYIRVTSVTDPTIVDDFAGLASIVTAVHDAGKKIELSLLSFADDVFAPCNIDQIVANAGKLATLVDNLWAKVAAVGADGVSIDWEAGEGGGMTTALCDDLFTALKADQPVGKTISAYYGYYYAVGDQAYCISPSVAGTTLDAIYIGAYWQWTKDLLVSDVLGYWVTWGGANFTKDKMYPCIILDGFTSPGGVQTGEYNEIVDTFDPADNVGSLDVVAFKGYTGTLVFQSRTEAKLKVAYLKANSWGGMMLFCLNQDKLLSAKGLLSAVYTEETVTGFTGVAIAMNARRLALII